MKINIKSLNFLFFLIGMTIVVLETHNWIAILGTFIASLHINLTKDKE